MNTRPRRTITYYLLLAAGILWNGWILGLLVYPHNASLHMEISELSIPAQPWSWLFRVLDGSSALGMIGAAAGLLAQYKQAARRWLAIAAALLLTMGLLTLFDITHSLDCVQYQHPACVAVIDQHLTSANDNAHNAESNITSYASIAFALCMLALAIRFKQRRSLVAVAIALTIGVVWSLAVLGETHDLFVYAVNDRLWNLWVSGDLLLLATILRQPQPTKNAG